MREILFRGKDIKGNWHIGLVAHIDNSWYISNKAGVSTAYEVIPETIGQYTGLTDKNGKKIFEGDIVCLPFTEDSEYGENIYYEYGIVYFDEKYFAFCVKFDDGETMFLEEYDDCANVTGNIHDKPELLKGDKDNGYT